jgi:16S rRNA (adenine1518-N6/adenine1519-N6)-dimethyltransferase
VRVVNEDILKLDLNQLLRNDRPWKLVGNLPYNISAPLVLRLLQLAACFSRLFIMLQTEVANRLAASPGTKAYGRLSVITQLRCSVIHRLDVDAASFRPKPAVRSSVVELSPIPGAKDQELEAWLSLLVDKAFSKRRKILANSLHQCIDLETLIRCDIDPTWRPEQLSVEDFLRLARETRPGTNVPATED